MKEGERIREKEKGLESGKEGTERGRKCGKNEIREKILVNDFSSISLFSTHLLPVWCQESH